MVVCGAGLLLGEKGKRRCPDLCRCLGCAELSPVVVDAHTLGASHPAVFLGIITRGTPLSIHILSTAALIPAHHTSCTTGPPEEVSSPRP